MKEDFVTYSQAVKLKELGFDWECNHYYNTQYEKFLPVEWFHYSSDVDADDLYESNPPKSIITSRVSAPTLTQAQKWLREIKEIDIIVCPIIPKNIKKYHCVIDKNNDLDFRLSMEKLHDNYESALSTGIDKVLEILKEDNNGK